MATLQIETAEVFDPLLEPSWYKGAYGGRGSGKSWFFAGAMVEEHIRGKTDSICLREVQKSLQFSSKKLIEETIARNNAGYYFEVQDKLIKATNGGIITFQGMQDHTSESIKSLEGFDRSWFEEAQNASQRSLDLLRPTLRKEGAEKWFSWNPLKEDDPVDVLLRGEHIPEGAIVVEANLDDNPWATDILLAEREQDRKQYDADKFANIWGGQYLKNTEGDYYKEEMAAVRTTGRICNIPRLDIPVNTFWDIGNTAGTAIWFHQQVGMEDRFIGYYEGHDEKLSVYALELQRRGFIYNKHFMPHDADHKRLSDTNKSVKEMMEDLGVKRIEIVPRVTSLDTGIQITKKYFPSAYFDTTECKFGIKRMDNYRKRYNTTDKRWMDEPDKKNGSSEAADALRQWAQAKGLGMITMAGATQFKRRDPGNWKTA